MFTVEFNPQSTAAVDQEGGESTTLTFSLLNNRRDGYLYREGMSVAVLDSLKPEKGWHKTPRTVLLSETKEPDTTSSNLFYYRSNVHHEFFQQQQQSPAGNPKT